EQVKKFDKVKDAKGTITGSLTRAKTHGDHDNCKVITSSSNVTATTSLPLDTLAAEDYDATTGLLKDSSKEKIEKALAESIKQPEFINPIDPETGELSSDPGALNYKYVVKVNGAVVEKDGKYILPVALEATLSKEEDSVVRLLIPKEATETPDSALVEMTSLESSQTTINGAWDPSQYTPVDVKLSAILDDNNKVKSIKDMLAKIPSLAGKYDDTAEFEFNTLNLTTSYPVADITTPISFVGSKKQEIVPGPTHSSSKPKPKPEEPMEPAVGIPTTMYRLYNRLTGEHLYTIDKNERDNLLTSDTWKDEGEGWIAPSESAYPVYRLLNPNNSDHHYTMDKNEFDTLPSYGWIAEGIAFFSADKDNPENVILYRLYNPNAEGAGSHHYTVDANERDTLVGLGWTYEGLAWAGLPEKK
ncbi:MAG: hypothetical protein K2H85_00015, partial [Allobaculum sp.]|nr:hypothetical protein [Allobaculum sp.]